MVNTMLCRQQCFFQKLQRIVQAAAQQREFSTTKTQSPGIACEDSWLPQATHCRLEAPTHQCISACTESSWPPCCQSAAKTSQQAMTCCCTCP